ncbi:MAG: patatin-like phospholipase family protein [Candidatus Omnitrophota bacterium]
MEHLDKDLILSEIPFFAGLSRLESSYIKEKSSIVEYKKGQIIYEEGSPASFFYCLISGRIMIFTRDNQGRERVLEYLHRGKYFGIISLLTQDPHSVNTRALNDCCALVIKKEDFDSILKKIPRLAIDLSQTLSRRLKNKDLHQKTVFESTVISVFSSYSRAGKSVYALNLALGLYLETGKSVIILDVCCQDKIHSLSQRMGTCNDHKIIDLSSSGFQYEPIKASIIKDKFGIDIIFFHYNPEDQNCLSRLVDIFTLLINDYNYLILDLPSLMDQFVFKALNQSDFIHILTSPDALDLKRTHHLMERLKLDFHFPESKIKVIINEYKISKLTHLQQMEFLGHSVFATLPRIEFKAHDRIILDDAESEYARAIRRISRQVGDRLVGLALGVGVAYGFCHIGVLKVIEEEKIPVDVISGSSIGAIIAGLWVTGRNSDEILEITQEFREPKYIWNLIDLTWPLAGFIKGNKLYNFLKKYFGNKTFYDVRLPLKIVASDIKKKEPIIIEKGLLVDAIMASCAMPGVFLPFAFKENILFDGGLIHPLPTEPLFMMGLSKIIAVNVTPSREDNINQREKLKAQFGIAIEAVKKRKWYDLNNYFKEKFKSNIIETIFTSIEFMQSELAQKEAQLADIVLHPNTEGMHWLELSRAKEFAKRGEEEARRNLDKIWKVINE